MAFFTTIVEWFQPKSICLRFIRSCRSMKASQDCHFWHEAKPENTSYFNGFFPTEERLHVAFPKVVMCWMHLKIAIALSKIVSC